MDDLPAVRGVLTQLEAEATDGHQFPGLLDASGVTLDRLRAFAEAAASFYTSRPWDHLTNEDLLIVGGDDMPRAMRHVSVLGAGGQQFGLAFFDSRAAFERVLDPTRGRPVSRAHGVTFGPVDELPFADVDAWEDYGLPVAARPACGSIPVLTSTQRTAAAHSG